MKRQLNGAAVSVAGRLLGNEDCNVFESTWMKSHISVSFKLE